MTLAGSSGDTTHIDFDLVESAYLKVSSGDTYTETRLNNKQLDQTVSSMIVGPFITNYNKANGTKMTASKNLKGLVIDGETPLDHLKDLVAQKCHAIIRDPRQCEVRVLLSSG